MYFLLHCTGIEARLLKKKTPLKLQCLQYSPSKLRRLKSMLKLCRLVKNNVLNMAIFFLNSVKRTTVHFGTFRLLTVMRMVIKNHLTIQTIN